jgi:hypothetical protein
MANNKREYKHNYIYQIHNIVNDMIYIGRRSTDKYPETDGYLGSGTGLKLARATEPKANFIKEIISYHDSYEEVVAEEARIVDRAFVDNPKTYNRILGGDLWHGKHLSKEAQIKKSESMKIAWAEGRKKSMWTDEQKKAHSEKMLNMSDETREKMSVSRRAHDINGMQGKTHSDETKRMMSETRTGVPIHDDEFKRKMSERLKGVPKSEEAKEKMRQRALGTEYVNKDGVTKRVSPDKKKQLLEEGWIPGTARRKTAWVNKEGEAKNIFLDELEKYLTNGWVRGRGKMKPLP